MPALEDDGAADAEACGLDPFAGVIGYPEFGKCGVGAVSTKTTGYEVDECTGQDF
jgi:hypothetical protein